MARMPVELNEDAPKPYWVNTPGCDPFAEQYWLTTQRASRRAPVAQQRQQVGLAALVVHGEVHHEMGDGGQVDADFGEGEGGHHDEREAQEEFYCYDFNCDAAAADNRNHDDNGDNAYRRVFGIGDENVADNEGGQSPVTEMVIQMDQTANRDGGGATNKHTDTLQAIRSTDDGPCYARPKTMIQSMRIGGAMLPAAAGDLGNGPTTDAGPACDTKEVSARLLLVSHGLSGVPTTSVAHARLADQSKADTATLNDESEQGPGKEQEYSVHHNIVLHDMPDVEAVHEDDGALSIDLGGEVFEPAEFSCLDRLGGVPGTAGNRRPQQRGSSAPYPTQSNEILPQLCAQKLLASCADCLMCRAAAAISRTAAHPHASSICSFVDVGLFPDHCGCVQAPMDLRTVADKLAQGLYALENSNEPGAGGEALLADVALVWASARVYNPPRSALARLVAGLEVEFIRSWNTYVTRGADGWLKWVSPSADALVPIGRGSRLPQLTTVFNATRVPPRRTRRVFVPTTPPPVSFEDVSVLPQHKRQRMLQSALPNRAPPPCGWSTEDVGGCSWHLREAFACLAAQTARVRAEECMRCVLAESKNLREVAMRLAEAGGPLVVTAAVGRRVLCLGSNDVIDRPPARGLYLPDGRVLDDDTRVPMRVAEFAGLRGMHGPCPLRSILLETASGVLSKGVSLETLMQMHGSTKADPAPPLDPQADPHCTLCQDGVSEPGNEIILCDGEGCVGCYHQKCASPSVVQVPDGTWLCQACVQGGNIIDPQLVESELDAVESCAGKESMVVLANDGVGLQDVPLLLDVLDVIDSSLPLIGRTNAAKLVFAPDHQSVVLVSSDAKLRRVLGAIVLKLHCQRGFLEIAFCVVRKEAQRGGIGSRLISRLKDHAHSLGILHLLTYADDSATGFFERLGFDVEPEHGMPTNRARALFLLTCNRADQIFFTGFHWGISHYTGSQLRQCVLEPDIATLYRPNFPHRVPQHGRRLFAECTHVHAYSERHSLLARG